MRQRRTRHGEDLAVEVLVFDLRHLLDEEVIVEGVMALRPRRRVLGVALHRSAAGRRFAGARRGARLCSLNSLYSKLSTSACKLASTTFSERPTVPQRSFPSPDSIRTRTFEAVPSCSIGRAACR